MEVIRFDGYTVDEKTAIARDYLWPRQLERNGLREDEVAIADDVILQLVVVGVHTRGRRAPARAGARQDPPEDGDEDRVRQVEAPIIVDLDVVRDALGRQKVFQEVAERTAVPGVATGLAVTGTGGDVLFVEATSMDGGSELVLTGQLGDVMKESARIALSYVRSHAEELGIESEAFKDRAFHVHVPAGAIPKDGPSAGITMATALASLLSERPVKHTVGMTGEVTLQGRVLPIGGLKQKVLAAHAAGLTDVIIPERNRADLDDVPADVREAMKFHPVMTLGEVLNLALEPKAKPSARMRCRNCKPLPEEVARAADLLGRRWMLAILWASAEEGAVRFNEFKQALEGIPPRTLAQRLVRARGRRRARAACLSTAARRGSSTSSRPRAGRLGALVDAMRVYAGV